MTDKIRITYEETESAEVDRKLRQQSATIRVMEHYQQRAHSGQGADSRNVKLLYNTLVFMALFGLIGGAAAWGITEIWGLLRNSTVSQVDRFRKSVGKIVSDVEQGIISREDAMNKIKDVANEFATRYPENPFFRILVDEGLSESERERKLKRLKEELYPQLVLDMAIFFALASMVIGAALSSADSFVTRNWNELVKMAMLGTFLGFLGGMIGGTVAQIVFGELIEGEDISFTKLVFARSIGWSIAGIGLAVAPGIAIRSAKKTIIGLAGGAIGGLLGGALFDPIAFATGVDWISRLVGFVGIGALAGLSTGLIEETVKTAWLKVTGGLLSGKQFILYRDVTTIGSSPKCDIYLFKDPDISPQHAEIVKTSRGYEIRDLDSHTGTLVNGSAVQRKWLQGGDQIQVGGTVFRFEQKKTGAHD